MAKTRLLVVAAVIGAVYCLAPSAGAMTFRSGQTVTVPEGVTVSGSLYAAGSTITVDGIVEGDVICAGESVVITGTVSGDVICAGSSITLGGEISGNARVAGSTVTMSGSVGRNANFFGSTVTMSSGATIGGDLMYGAATADIRGAVTRDLDGFGMASVLGGSVGRDAYVWSDSSSSRKGKAYKNKEATAGITVEDGATIGGNFGYTANSEPVIAEGATIGGETIRHEFKAPSRDHKAPLAAWFWWRLISLFSALVIGLVIITCFSGPLRAMTSLMFARPNAALGWGLFALFVVPLIAVALMFTVIGIPLALIIVAFWVIAMYLSKIVVAIVLGMRIMKSRPATAGQDNTLTKPFWPMVVGIIIAYAVFSIPVIGWALCLLAMIWGLGGMWLYGREKCQTSA